MGDVLLHVDLRLVPCSALENIPCDWNYTALRIPAAMAGFVFQPWTPLPLGSHVAVVFSVQLVSGRPQ